MCLSALACFIYGTYSPEFVEGAVPIFDPRKCLEDMSVWVRLERSNLRGKPFLSVNGPVSPDEINGVGGNCLEHQPSLSLLPDCQSVDCPARTD